ncbi:MFS family permease [Microbacterium resistens]|uniref:MFS family permease n=1 Tax=Microbacterium resistens TaxID=156977 RepID=A0ABU1SDS2_9MICO|nr:MFS transporter [Microbacterium resistens]MDR6867744.1 MFS family permease [Microbacterium resistens]
MMRPAAERTPSTSVWRTPGMPALVVMAVAGFSGYALLMPVAPLWAAHGGADATGTGLVTGVFMLCTVLAQLFVPAALRRLGWTPVLVAGLLLLGLPALALLFSDELVPVLAIAAVRGAGFAILTVAGSSAVAELVEPARRGRAIGVFGLGIAGPQVILLPLAPWVAEHLGFGVVFAAAACPVLGVLGAIRLGRRLDALPEHPEPEHADLHGGLRRFRGLLPPVVLLLGVTLAGGALLTFTPQLAPDATMTMVGLLLLTGLAALVRWGIGHVADRFGPRRLLWPFVIVTALGLGLVSWSVAGGGGGVAFLAGMALVGVSYGGLQTLTMGAAFAAVPRRDQVVASAVWNIGFDAGTGIGAVVVGAIATGSSFSTALLAAAAISIVTLPLAFVRGRRQPASTADGDRAG